MNTANLFGVPIEGYGLEDVISAVGRKPHGPLWIVTANPEILLEAKRNRSYAQTIKRADVHTVDGFGLWMILRLFGVPTHRLTGVELSEYLLKYAEAKNWNVALIGGKMGVPSAAAANIKQRFPELHVHAEEGGLISPDGNDDEDGARARKRIAEFAPKILFVAFGHPKQEMWISKHAAEFSGLRIVVGVGGTVDFWARTRKRAPAFMRSIGLEWLWRLAFEPSRWKRIWNAVVVFPITAAREIIVEK